MQDHHLYRERYSSPLVIANSGYGSYILDRRSRLRRVDAIVKKMDESERIKNLERNIQVICRENRLSTEIYMDAVETARKLFYRGKLPRRINSESYRKLAVVIVINSLRRLNYSFPENFLLDRYEVSKSEFFRYMNILRSSTLYKSYSFNTSHIAYICRLVGREDLETVASEIARFFRSEFMSRKYAQVATVYIAGLISGKPVSMTKLSKATGVNRKDIRHGFIEITRNRPLMIICASCGSGLVTIRGKHIDGGDKDLCKIVKLIYLDGKPFHKRLFKYRCRCGGKPMFILFSGDLIDLGGLGIEQEERG